jgi:hypothetical protein
MPGQESVDMFWVWWVLTLALAVGQIARASYRPREWLGFASIAAVLWLYFYVYLPYQLIGEQRLAFRASLWNFAQFTAFASLLSLLIGWHWKLHLRRREVRAGGPERRFDIDRLWWSGVGALGIGLIGFYSFTRSGREFSETSAYWYLLFNTCYPGIALAVAAMVLSPRHRTAGHTGLLLLLSALIVVPLLTGARRGPTFVAIMACFFSFAAVRRKPIQPVVVLSVLGVAGALVLVQVGARRVTYGEGGTWQEYLETVRFDEVLGGRARQSADNEYFNHCQMLEANLRTGVYQYGTAHLAALLNWVPRAFWPAKPERGTGFFPEALRQMERDESSNLGVGGGWGVVADSFNNYWYFFPLFWMGIGWLTGAAFLKAHGGHFRSGGLNREAAQVVASLPCSSAASALPWELRNVGILCAAHWFIAQNFAEAFVPFMIYQGVFFIAFRYSAVDPRLLVRRANTCHSVLPGARRRSPLENSEQENCQRS